jgi:FkbM family methyltransferase
MGLRSIKRAIATSYLRETSLIYLRNYPQVACFSFDVIGNSINIDGVFEKDELIALERVIRSQIGSNGICLDIGANIGNHAIFFSRLFSRVYAFEPNPRTYKLLCLNSENWPNIVTVDKAASDQNGKVQAIESARNIGATKIITDEKLSESQKGIEFDAICLDDWIATNLPDCKIDFLKIDVEGHELNVIRGLSRTLSEQNPILALEVLDASTNEAQEIFRTLASLNYTNMYCLKSSRPFSNAPKFISNAVFALVTALYKRMDHNFRLQRTSSLTEGSFPLLIFSKTEIVVE